MLCLDCESVDAAFRSVEAILHLTRQQLESFFQGFDFDGYAEEHWRKSWYDPDRVLLTQLKAAYGITPDAAWSATCFFHLTRTLDASQFANGIEPLTSARLDAIWAALYTLVYKDLSSAEWNQFRRDMGGARLSEYARHYAYLYGMKTRDVRTHGGPYGLLIRASAFQPKALMNHDYLGIPEIVEDIGICCEDVFHIPLCERFQQQAQPCIVKFCVQDRYYASNDALGIALRYLYDSLHNSDPLGRPWSYDARGSWISAAQIESVECPPGVVIWPNGSVVP